MALSNGSVLCKYFRSGRRRPLLRSFNSAATQFTELVTKPSSRYQLYISRSDDPFINLSIEHYLLERSPINSTLLFLYVNRPSVVIGRNQNPWLEANLQLLKSGFNYDTSQSYSPANVHQGIDLVRRRSGGGTVFHDLGNVNYSVICPPDNFTRDKHVEMVVQAIRKDNPRARVNERHDIVLDLGDLREKQTWPDHSDMHKTRYSHCHLEIGTRKVSGSAYKLTRNRSLHHGTCLIQSPNLHKISRYLHSPARPFMRARGVDSVRSPVGNVHPHQKAHNQLLNNAFQRNVLEAFVELYNVDQSALTIFTEPHLRTSLRHRNDWASGYLDETVAETQEIRSGINELKSPDWIYGQTPQFVLGNLPSAEDDRDRPALPEGILPSARVFIKTRSGTITASEVSLSSDEAVAKAERERYSQILDGIDIHTVSDFRHVLRAVGSVADPARENLSAWLNVIFGK